MHISQNLVIKLYYYLLMYIQCTSIVGTNGSFCLPFLEVCSS